MFGAGFDANVLGGWIPGKEMRVHHGHVASVVQWVLQLVQQVGPQDLVVELGRTSDVVEDEIIINNNLLLIRHKYLYEYIQMRLTSYIKIVIK